jgi:DNA-binding NarL/FixJ family response regulator
MALTKRVNGSKTQVFLVDDHPIVRRGFQLLLSLESDLAVCGEADSGPVALDKVLALKPDVVIVDLSLKASSGLELIKQLRAQSVNAKLLVFTMQDEGIYAERALRAGADGYITKEEGTEKAIAAIRLLMQGKRYVSDHLAEKMMDKLTGNAGAETAIETLTDRELEVLQHIGHGLGSREMAEKLHLSIKTIESHREHIKSKLGLTRATELVNYAFSWVHNTGGGPKTESPEPAPAAATQAKPPTRPSASHRQKRR